MRLRDRPAPDQLEHVRGDQRPGMAMAETAGAAGAGELPGDRPGAEAGGRSEVSRGMPTPVAPAAVPLAACPPVS